jgi:hypothetical protein
MSMVLGVASAAGVASGGGITWHYMQFCIFKYPYIVIWTLIRGENALRALQGPPFGSQSTLVLASFSPNETNERQL